MGWGVLDDPKMAAPPGTVTLGGLENEGGLLYANLGFYQILTWLRDQISQRRIQAR
jgi:hypothetical protein